MNLSLFKRCSFAPPFALLLISSCERGDAPEVETHPELAAVEQWEPADPDHPPEGTPVGTHGWLSVNGLKLVNQDGEPVQLRGVSSMWLNWDKKGYGIDREGMKWMRDNWGVTVFRAAMGVEEDGGFLASPLTMTKQMRRIIQNAIDLGVYVLVDWHDHQAHLHLEKSTQFFEAITAEFGEYANLIYEPYNEPLHPNQFSWAGDIKPYHEAIVPVIRAGSPNSVIILGTPQWSQLVDQAAEDPVAGENLMYTLHFYSCTHTEWLRETADKALALGAPLFVTEWGATSADGGVMDKTVCADEAQLWHDWMNTNGISWAAWKLDGCADTSCIFASGAPTNGGWATGNLQGHGPFVVERLLAP